MCARLRYGQRGRFQLRVGESTRAALQWVRIGGVLPYRLPCERAGQRYRKPQRPRSDTKLKSERARESANLMCLIPVLLEAKPQRTDGWSQESCFPAPD